MLLTSALHRYCESLISIYRFAIAFHDEDGGFLEMLPPLAKEYIDEYNQRNILAELLAGDPDRPCPSLVANYTTDLWASFPCVFSHGVKGYVVVGPVFRSDISESTLHSLLNDSHIRPRTRELYERHKNELPVLGYHEFIRVLRQMVFMFTGKDFDPVDIGLSASQAARDVVTQVKDAHRQLLFDETMTHATYSFERYMLSCIAEGNVPKLLRHLNNQMPGTEGILSKGDPLRQARNMFIVSATLVTRAAIEGGLNPEIAMSLSDLFIQQIENQNDISRILVCQTEMVMEFTHRVEAVHHHTEYSKEITACCYYIQEHIAKNTRISDLAEYVHLSENYLSAKFKAETGQSITNYIKQAKIREAKNLLINTDLNLTEISTMLAYSSQSFFTTVFRSVIGMTPKQFRRSSGSVNE